MLLSLLCLGATYYVSPSGSSGNTGLVPTSPWPIDYAMLHISASNTVVALPGTYSNQVIIRKSYTTLISPTKWMAKIYAPTGLNASGISVWPAPIDHVTIDGFEIGYSGQSAIQIYGSNVTVRNCWIHDSGQGHNVNNGSAILTVTPQPNTLVERCLLEHNGYSSGYDHGGYLGGTNIIFRNNVSRYNLGYGVSFYNGLGGCDLVQAYNNLCYGNYGDAFNNGHQMGFNSLNVPGTTNYAYDNTLITPLGKAFFVEWTTLMATNNIIISTNDGFNVFSPSGTVSWAFGDYNLAPQALYTAGAHDVISSNYAFVNPVNGLYWLSSTSAARCRTLPGVFGPVDFFGNTQSGVCDIGAFQYQAPFTADTRVLDPSSVCGADYWTILYQ